MKKAEGGAARDAKDLHVRAAQSRGQKGLDELRRRLADEDRTAADRKGTKEAKAGPVPSKQPSPPSLGPADVAKGKGDSSPPPAAGSGGAGGRPGVGPGGAGKVSPEAPFRAPGGGAPGGFSGGAAPSSSKDSEKSAAKMTREHALTPTAGHLPLNDTALWLPALGITDGQAVVPFPAPDRTTTYRVLVFGNDPSGRLGFYHGTLTVPAVAK
jgi:hypothetical protein